MTSFLEQEKGHVILYEKPKKEIICSSNGIYNTKGDENDLTDRNNIVSILNNRAPEFFQNFELCEHISNGSAGYVYKGIYKGKNSKRQVAIKFLIKEKKDKKISSNSQEIAISKKLHNKNIIETLAHFKKDDFSYSVLEYGKYGDMENFLKKLLKRNVFSETILAFFAKQILEGLVYIHKCKIVHLDIKPTNILIDSNLNTKITDFSVSCSYEAFLPEDTVKFPYSGTERFIAPEIFSRAHMKIKDTEKIDIYSFGVTLYYLFYGEYPYKFKDIKSQNFEEVLKEIEEKKLVFHKNRNISDMLKDFLSKTLEKDYRKRINIRQALNHPWIKGAQIIFDEKENNYCTENFLINLITDNIPKFNKYIKAKKDE